MELLQLRYFQTVAHTQHMTSAAHQLNVAQSALSKSIAALEEELGVQLFDRVGRRIKLNYYGESFLKNIDKVLKLLDYSVKQVQALPQGGFYEIKLLVVAASTLVPELLTAFCERHPNVTFKLAQNETKSAGSWGEEYDLCLTSSPTPSQAANTVNLFQEEVAFGVAPDHPLGRREGAYFEELEHESFIVPYRGNNFREIVDYYCKMASFKPNIVSECDSPIMVHSLVKSGLGVGFVSCRSWGASYDSSIRLVRIKDFVCQRSIQLSWPENRHLSLPGRLFVEFVQKYFSEIS